MFYQVVTNMSCLGQSSAPWENVWLEVQSGKPDSDGLNGKKLAPLQGKTLRNSEFSVCFTKDCPLLDTE